MKKNKRMMQFSGGDFILLIIIGWIFGASLVAGYVLKSLPVYIVAVGNTISMGICSYRIWRKGTKAMNYE